MNNKQYIGIGKVPKGIGAIIKGWDIEEKNYRNPTKLPVVDFRAMTESCPHNCFHCFTDKNKKTLSLDEIKNVINQLSEMNTHSINFLGEGEPTIDKDFFQIIEYTSSKGIQPLIFTDAATKLLDEKFVQRIYDSGSSIIPKCDSLFNSDYQNWVVGDKTKKYFTQRNQAINLLIKNNFNEIKEDGTTRLGFDMVLSSKNVHEVEQTLKYCRENNLWIIFSWYLPSGRSGRENFDKSLMVDKKQKKETWKKIKEIDKEYGFDHSQWNNFATMPCVEFMQIYGDGRVSPCPGNEKIIGNIQNYTINELEKRILDKYPCHNRTTFEGHCLYREKI